MLIKTSHQYLKKFYVNVQDMNKILITILYMCTLCEKYFICRYFFITNLFYIKIITLFLF